ncbi:MAG: O-acetyl-ADP-ribose deacetylase [Tenericutes bacterium]|nr:O-acetyl-ADP-ribose deacetylase [Mycoplasmatota bacterium]
MTNIEVVQGDITRMDVDIVVNAANTTLLGGGGVDGAIHRRAGKELLEECRTLGGCRTGEAKMTNGYNMRCSKIIHTVGPVYHGGNNGEAELLKNCYFNSMMLAEEYRFTNGLGSISIAFPCISTGVYGYPKKEACKIAVETIKEINNSKIKVFFVCFEEDQYQLYLDEINK